MRDAAFVDTSAFVALRNEREREHTAARRALRDFVERRVPRLTSSYVDATSFALMARERITVALSFDRDFAHRGLALVPASPRRTTTSGQVSRTRWPRDSTPRPSPGCPFRARPLVSTSDRPRWPACSLTPSKGARMTANEERHLSGPRQPQGCSCVAPGGALHALVGSQRAMLLGALGRPRSIGELDELLFTASGGATYHVRRLEAAGVVMRHRRGQRVIVELTGRGRNLLAVFGA